MSFVYSLADHGRTFATRPRGVALRQDVVNRAAGAREIELDFADVLSVSYSFADEFVASLVEAGTRHKPPFRVSVVEASDEVSRVIDRACGLRLQTGRSETPPCFA